MSTTGSPYASPIDALRRLLNHFFSERDADDAMGAWHDYATDNPDQARHLLDRASEVLDDPPADLADILQQDGMVYLEEPDGASSPLSQQVAWLRSTLGRFRGALDAETASPAGLLVRFLERFWVGRAESQVMAGWRDFAAAEPDQAEATLRALEQVAADPPADLNEILRRHGWVDLHHDDASMTPFTTEESARWVRRVARWLWGTTTTLRD